MAEKEERILCSCYTGIQAELMANNNIGMTRQDAIERMAKAMCQSLNHCGPCRYKNDKEKCEAAIDFHWGFAAKAALNALLDTPTLEERVEEIMKNNPGIPDYDEFYKALREGK